MSAEDYKLIHHLGCNLRCWLILRVCPQACSVVDI